MKLLVVVFAVLSLTTALPQRRASQKSEQQADDQQTAEQNYNNYQQQEDYRQQQQEYRQQQQQQQQPQQQQQEFRQAKPIEDFRPKVTLETTTFIPIIHFDKEQGTDGSYKTSYETGNHIQAQEQGYLRNVESGTGENNPALVQSGSYQYTAPDGQIISVEYTADEFGFRVSGDHIPTPPPVSAEIQKGLDLIYAGIKANAERAAIEAKNNPEAAKQQETRAALDYKGQYYQQ